MLTDDLADKVWKQHFIVNFKLQIWQDCSINNSELIHERNVHGPCLLSKS